MGRGTIFSVVLALTKHLQSLYWLVIRGYAMAPGDKAEVVHEDEWPFLSTSESAEEDGIAADSRTWARLVQNPVLPEPGVNEPRHKDLLFYPDPESPDVLWIAVQHPERLSEWTAYPASGYGEWFRRELDLYIRLTRGL
ncbi:Putative uncharacterized protein [Thermobacillus xylanilyticus]|nr:Putative uncharacterized protein [Thermobacillus xylanilyticus]